MCIHSLRHEMAKVKAVRRNKKVLIQSNVFTRPRMMLKTVGTRCFCSTSRLMAPLIQLKEPGTAGIIMLNRPKYVNAITHEMSEEIYHALKEFELTKTHVIIKGACGRSFSIGRDMSDIMVNPLSVIKERFRNEFRSFYLIAEYKKPFIAIIDGLALGGACGYAMCGKIRIATERSTVAMPETSVGFFGASGASHFLSRLRYNVGIYLGMTGIRLRGFDIKKTGLATHFVESKKLKALENDLELIESSDEVGKCIANYSAIPMTIETELDHILPRIEQCFDAPSVEEIYENLRKDGSKWAKETINLLNLKSPTSLKIVHRQLYLGKMLTWKQCLKMEFRIAVQHVIESDMKEGCRAILFEKDENPKWNPRTLKEVTKDHVDRFFQPVPDGDELKFDKH